MICGHAHEMADDPPPVFAEDRHPIGIGQAVGMKPFRVQQSLLWQIGVDHRQVGLLRANQFLFFSFDPDCQIMRAGRTVRRDDQLKPAGLPLGIRQAQQPVWSVFVSQRFHGLEQVRDQTRLVGQDVLVMDGISRQTHRNRDHTIDGDQADQGRFDAQAGQCPVLGRSRPPVPAHGDLDGRPFAAQGRPGSRGQQAVIVRVPAGQQLGQAVHCDQA